MQKSYEKLKPIVPQMAGKFLSTIKVEVA